ncbi:hypothetical protein HYALB_00007068 [Hymenoscyphus albidus]|uniref:Uncharacterized protein n=1 Tax=Hymenoscyphus albidus TaxID=595503 RepID=A0A9N9LKT2_9HELO|nr:hypothetical protein HYALB_00007068 [Hymenoscyphus albidus]
MEIRPYQEPSDICLINTIPDATCLSKSQKMNEKIPYPSLLDGTDTATLDREPAQFQNQDLSEPPPSPISGTSQTGRAR